MRWRWVGTKNAVVGRRRRSTSSAVGASKRLRMASDPPREQGARRKAHRDRVVHGRAHHVQVVWIEMPDRGLVLEDRLGGRLVPDPRGHPLGRAGRSRGVVHRSGQRIAGQIGLGPLHQLGQGALVEHRDPRRCVDHQAVPFSRRQRGVEEDRNNPAACRTEHRTDQVGRRAQAKGDPIANRTTQCGQGAGGMALAGFGVKRGQELDARSAAARGHAQSVVRDWVTHGVGEIVALHDGACTES